MLQRDSSAGAAQDDSHSIATAGLKPLVLSRGELPICPWTKHSPGCSMSWQFAFLPSEKSTRFAFGSMNRCGTRSGRTCCWLICHLKAEPACKGIIGRSPALRALLKQVAVVAPTDSTVLISGETGSGKELIAQAIHDASPRHNGPLVKVNCSAIPENLFESEFFGHARGAFTGALRDKPGRFEMADGGTIFLDEIGELPPAMQSKLLRVLQEQEIERVGETRTRKINVRVIAATNRDLRQAVDGQRSR